MADPSITLDTQTPGAVVRVIPTSVRARRIGGTVLAYCVMIAVSIILILPLLWLFAASLKTQQLVLSTPRGFGEFFASLVPSDPQFVNYSEALTRRPFGLWTRNTMIIVVLATAGTLLSASMAAYAFARLRFPGRQLLFTVTLSTLMLPFIVTMIPQFLMFSKIPGPSSAGNWTDTLMPLILPHWLGGGAFYIFLMRQFFTTIPHELDEAARIDGAGFFRSYWQITLPLSGPVLATVTIFSFITNWNDFLAPLIYLASRQNQTLALGLQSFQGEFSNEHHLLMAASATMTVPVLLVFFFMQKYFLRGFVMSGIAGR
ncbi:MAG: carbohydrate ABC transporter permease [Chloroflexi bacterium]|nr:carbohydrate ABC transporter permease [Chloroflexota bacterium]